MGARAGAEDLEDETGAVDHLALPSALQIALLHRRDSRIDHGDPDGLHLDRLAQRRDRTAAEQRRGPHLAQRHNFGARYVEFDRPRQPDRLVETRLRRAAAIDPFPLDLERWMNDQRAAGRRTLGMG
jgi:hypothetical protein